MRIGILTFHKPINYGAFLQAFALSKQLANRFPEHSVEIIDYMAPSERRKIPIDILWGIKHYGLKNGSRDVQKIRAFHRVYKTLALSQMTHFKSLPKMFKFIDESYDMLIIGSDAIFNWNQTGYPTAFIPVYDFKHCIIVSYAASVHGLRYQNEPHSRLIECGNVFKKMPLVGVRDQNTENFVHTCFDHANCIHCCDPTVVIDLDMIKEQAGDFKNRILKKYNCDLSKKYIVLMLPDCSLTKIIFQKYSGQYQIITLFKPSADAQFYLYDLTPFEWASVLSEASMVITSYFHGTLLSLRYATPVLAIDFSCYNNPYESKLRDLLCTRLNLPELYFDSEDIESSDSQNTILSTIDNAIKGTFKRQIQQSLAEEALSFSGFCNSLQMIINNNSEVK